MILHIMMKTRHGSPSVDWKQCHSFYRRYLNEDDGFGNFLDDVIGHVTIRHFRHFYRDFFETPTRGFNLSTLNLVSKISRHSRCQIVKLLCFRETLLQWGGRQITCFAMTQEAVVT